METCFTRVRCIFRGICLLEYFRKNKEKCFISSFLLRVAALIKKNIERITFSDLPIYFINFSDLSICFIWNYLSKGLGAYFVEFVFWDISEDFFFFFVVFYSQLWLLLKKLLKEIDSSDLPIFFIWDCLSQDFDAYFVVWLFWKISEKIFFICSILSVVMLFIKEIIIWINCSSFAHLLCLESSFSRVGNIFRGICFLEHFCKIKIFFFDVLYWKFWLLLKNL